MPNARLLRGSGGCDFAEDILTAPNPAVFWTPSALPSIVPLGAMRAEVTPTDRSTVSLDRAATAAQLDAERILTVRSQTFRVQLTCAADTQNLCALLPLDEFFSARLTAARRLWLAANGRNPGKDPARLTGHQRARLVLSLRALDARLEDTSYRDIAAALFGPKRVPTRGWKTHDLRGRTIGLANRGAELMQGGYRQLLLYPFRKRRF